ncbi:MULTISPECIES: Fe-S protein assembly co-chaperone HscB [unclassified Chromobacterium]|uniref:Fe-S protein assembly co-chaperone HscB n=1 Tax=unclassified Chromobacterium TaxID=2641838 RepID=UPI0006534A3E|nr:Fe-S protein assembly co-chaperone HscB [Chromobacterium sp. LK1]KMN29808.1 cobalamin [Chromobacterium sp. LK1]
MSTDFSQDFFSLFDLPRRFAIDSQALEQAWRTAAAQVHPDRYASGSDADKRSALMQATRVNEAYQTLKSPLNRARYLLTLAGVDTQEDTNTQMPTDFLMAQMEWRENIEAARDADDLATLETLSRQLRAQSREHQAELEQALDQRSDLDAAALLVRKLRFLQKLDQEIGDAIEGLLG